MKLTLVYLFVVAFISTHAQTNNPGGTLFPQKIEDYKLKNMPGFYGLTNKKVNPNHNKSFETIAWLENTIGYTKDNSGVYQKSFKNEYMYNQSDMQIATYQSIWQDSAWNLSYKDTLIYNATENTFERISSTYIDNAWQPVFRLFQQYDDLQNITIESWSNWVDGSEVVNRQLEYFYNENRLDSLIVSWDNGDELEQTGKGIYNYDENDYLVRLNNYTWSFDNWVESSITDYENDASGTIQTAWLINNNDTLTKAEYFYNALNIDTLILVSAKDGNGVFQPDVKEVYVYDDAGNLIEFRFEDFTNDYWDLIIYQSSTHDLDESAADYIYPKDWVEIFEMVNKITEFNQLWKIDSAIYDDSKFFFNYSLIDGINKHEAASIRVYPNPAKDHILVINDVIPNASIEVYNLSGVQLYSEFQQDTEVEIDLSRFPAGVYIIRVFNNQSSKVVKIVKE